VRTIEDANVAVKHIDRSPEGVVEIEHDTAGFIVHWYLEAASAVWAKIDMTFNTSFDGLEFDYEFLSEPGAEGYLTIYLDGNVIGHIDERYKEIGVRRSPRFALGNIESGEHTLSLRIDPYTDIASSVQITQLAFYHQATNVTSAINVPDILSGGSTTDDLPGDVNGDKQRDLAETLSILQQASQ